MITRGCPCLVSVLAHLIVYWTEIMHTFLKSKGSQMEVSQNLDGQTWGGAGHPTCGFSFATELSPDASH